MTMATRSFPLIAFLSAVVTVGAVPALAQSPCEIRLQEAGALYEQGKLPEARGAVAGCLAGGPSRMERSLAGEWMAKIDLADDDNAAARRDVERLLRDDPAYAPNTITESPRFLRLIDEVRRAQSTVRVSSVSKTPESLREAPATVVVVTREEIERRGYRDLEAILHDLPGFDISRTNGLSYSNFYQRGYRSDLPTRTQLLMDGVEENELWTQAAYLSRQYPVSNVERVEVIYGPASTMYGANAFAGVINVITREPESYLADGRRTATEVTAFRGAFDTNSLEIVTAGKTANGNLRWSLAGRAFHSDEMDLSHFSEWDYSVDTIDYRAVQTISGLNDQGLYNAQVYLDKNKLDASPYFTVQRDAAGVATRIDLTAAGIQRARDLDRPAYQNLDGKPAHFSDQADDWSLHGRVNMPNLELGFQLWRRAEGFNPSHADQTDGPGKDGLLWIPQQYWVYARYSRALAEDLTVTLFSRYLLDELGNPTEFNVLKGYAGGKLSIADLVAGTQATWIPTYYSLSNSQLHNELTAVYTPSARMTVVSGLEVKSSSMQGNYVTSSTQSPEATGSVQQIPPPPPGGNHFSVLDTGLYLQGSFALPHSFKVVAGGRLDNNRVNGATGYGTVFNPRLALLYAPPGPLVLKAIWSEAFQDASNFQKYVSVAGSALANPALQPERVKNFELNASWQAGKRFSVEASAYDAHYSNVAQFLRVPCTGDANLCLGSQTINQFQGIGALHIRGFQADAKLRLGSMSLFANYTFTDPWNEQLNVRVADIASHHVNAGVNAPLGGRIDLDLRANYVGQRKTGPGTDVPTNPRSEIGGAVVANLALRIRGVLPRTDLQIAIDNVANKFYFDPGIRSANGVINTSAVPQPGRTLYVQLSTKF